MEIIDIIHIVYQKIAHTESKMPRMIHQVAILIYQNGEAIRTITESENYFDRLIAVESCNLQFFFDKEKQSDDMEYHDNWMYCYFTEVCYEQAGIIYGQYCLQQLTPSFFRYVLTNKTWTNCPRTCTLTGKSLKI